MAEKTTQQRIKSEQNRLTRIFKEVDRNSLAIAKPLIKNAAFMGVTLEILQDEITEKGVVSEYKNGKDQFGTKKSPEVETYNTMIKNYAAVIRQLCELLPQGDTDAAAELKEFIKKREERRRGP